MQWRVERAEYATIDWIKLQKDRILRHKKIVLKFKIAYLRYTAKN